MMAKALNINFARKVHIIGRRLEKIQEAASNAVGIEFSYSINDTTVSCSCATSWSLT